MASVGMASVGMTSGVRGLSRICPAWPRSGLDFFSLVTSCLFHDDWQNVFVVLFAEVLDVHSGCGIRRFFFVCSFCDGGHNGSCVSHHAHSNESGYSDVEHLILVPSEFVEGPCTREQTPLILSWERIPRLDSGVRNHAAASTITIRSHLHQNLENLLIPLEEISLATSDFSPENQIGEGGFGRVYKGQLSGRWENRTAAFKRHDLKGCQREEEFRNEFQMMSSLRHDKIIQLIGYCDEGGEKIIIYDYAVNGSLESHFTGRNERRCPTWEQRLKICIGAAIAIKHLQASHGEDKILVHRNVKSGTILSDDNMEPLISGSGFSIVVDKNQGHVYDNPAGTKFYIDPIYQESGIVKPETDVYSLGVVLFEMLSGMLAWHKRRTGNNEPQLLMNLVRRLNLKERPSWNRIIKRLEEALRIQVSILT
ncbi:protein kinase, ATP binding site-containing protein [Tanacetum coccineum]